jgi:hypothetical protein
MESESDTLIQCRKAIANFTVFRWASGAFSVSRGRSGRSCGMPNRIESTQGARVEISWWKPAVRTSARIWGEERSEERTEQREGNESSYDVQSHIERFPCDHSRVPGPSVTGEGAQRHIGPVPLQVSQNRKANRNQPLSGGWGIHDSPPSPRFDGLESGEDEAEGGSAGMGLGA